MIAKNIYARAALLLVFLLLFCSSGVTQEYLSVSLIQLIANPEKYDGKQVQVIGFLRLEFEGNRLYLHEVDYDHNISENAVRLGLSKKQRQELEDKNMQYVILAGTYKAENGRALGNGTIADVSRVLIWPPSK